LEYAYDDFCLAQVAKGLGEKEVYEQFQRQSDNWMNLWRNVSDQGFSGFIMPKDANGNWLDSVPCSSGSFIPYTPRAKDWPKCVCWWCGFFYEGNSWEYSFFVPHDVTGLIRRCGGPETFRKRLDTFFEKSFYDVSNEPCFLTPCLYHWIGRPDLSGERVKAIVESYYHDGHDGIPGNDDSGAMSSWLAYHMLGLYPNAGQSYYLLHAPLVEESVIHLDSTKSFRILAEHVAPENRYVQAVRLNGQPYELTWIEHSVLIKGGELVFEMGPKPSSWGNGQSPPSKSH
jgi:predicted alpha-1,2-mannosidase